MFKSTKKLIRCINSDIFPDNVVRKDFGIFWSDCPEKVYSAISWAYKNGLVSDEELNISIYNGFMLTDIVHREHEEKGKNPYRCKIEIEDED